MVDDYKTIKKSSIDEVIKRSLEVEHITSVPIEHYSQVELKELAKKAKESDLVVTLKSEYSNVYQGIMINVIKRKNINDTFKKYI